MYTVNLCILTDMDGFYSTLSERGYWSKDEKSHSGVSVVCNLHLSTSELEFM